MNFRYTAGCAIGLLLILTGCSTAPPPARDTRPADTKTIQDGEAAWNHDFASKDLDEIASHYSDDAVLMLPGTPVAKGKDAIRNSLKDFLQDKNAALTFTAETTDVAKSGDIAYTQGTYSLTSTDPRSKKPITQTGDYVTVYKKQSDGSWKAVEDISTAGPPATPPPATQPVRKAQKRGKPGRRRSR